MQLRHGFVLMVLVLALVGCGRTINGNSTVFGDEPAPGELNPQPMSNEQKVQTRDAWAQVGIPTLEQQGGLSIPDQQLNGGVYMTIWNFTGQTDRLVGAQTDAAEQAVLVETVNNGGIKAWRPLENIYFASGEGANIGNSSFVTLSPDRYQIILTNVKQPLQAGETIQVTLQFEKAGDVPVEVEVRDIASLKKYTGQ